MKCVCEQARAMDGSRPFVRPPVVGLNVDKKNVGWVCHAMQGHLESHCE